MVSDHNTHESSAISATIRSEFSRSQKVHHVHDYIPTTPYCFIADIDSTSFVIDSGTNRIIVDDASLFPRLAISDAKIKGIEGSPVRIKGVGKYNLSLKSDNGTLSTVKSINAVLVPSAPYNVMLSQVFVKQMKASSFHIDYFKHNDRYYVFTYTLTSTDLPLRLTISIPIVYLNFAQMKATPHS